MNPCPFCGSTVVEPYHTNCDVFVQCWNCHSRGPIVPCYTKDDKEPERRCIELWNQRKETYTNS